MKAVILAGGAGTRLWPLSRGEKPKQFQTLIGNQSLFQKTLDRLNFLNPRDIYIATNFEYAGEIKKQAPKIPARNIIIEPALRDTASCIGLAAIYLQENFPDEVMAIIYADHLVQKKAEFVQKLKVAGKLAREENTLNIIEVKATFPNINLGYVQIGRRLKKIEGVEVYEFKKFTEKPNLKTAQKFIASKKYLWNTGFYVWKIKTILEQYQKYLPETYQRLIKIQKALDTPSEKKVIKKEYPLCPKISVDYALMEKVDPLIVRIIPADLGWSDIGTWKSLYDELIKRKGENLKRGPQINLKSKGCLIYNYDPKKLITTIGLKDLVIVNSRDALLICPLEKSSEVKNLVEELKKKKKKFT